MVVLGQGDLNDSKLFKKLIVFYQGLIAFLFLILHSENVQLIRVLMMFSFSDFAISDFWRIMKHFLSWIVP